MGNRQSDCVKYVPEPVEDQELVLGLRREIELF
jgi:hypothetical protein